jgi:hypothetical protein
LVAVTASSSLSASIRRSSFLSEANARIAMVGMLRAIDRSQVFLCFFDPD